MSCSGTFSVGHSLQDDNIVKVEKKELDILNICVQNIDCGYTLEPPRRGGSNEYPQSMF